MMRWIRRLLADVHVDPKIEDVQVRESLEHDLEEQRRMREVWLRLENVGKEIETLAVREGSRSHRSS